MTVKELIEKLRDLDPDTQMFTTMFSEFRQLEPTDIIVISKEGLKEEYGQRYLLQRPDGNIMMSWISWMTGDPKLDGVPITGVCFRGN